ncbi:MerR family transcriptional regulator [Parapedobacter sp. 2B3]|uniref:MerR family transcriptional regulator n=1 Tax=Parapedobacter sp. 2B3 TaxID=3342381 RepID=UPI0035B6A31A
MLIGQLSKASGLSRDTIRFYERQGLIIPGRGDTRFNNYKEYSNDILERLLSIKRLKNFGFTLKEVSGLLDMLDAQTATCGNLSHKIDEKVLLIEQKISELKAVRKQLLDGKRGCQDESGNLKTPGATCPVFVH